MNAISGPPAVALFDVDGTLLDTGGAGGKAWRDAFQELHGVPAEIVKFTEAGETDTHIAFTTFRAVVGREPSREEVGRLLAVYLLRLQDELDTSAGYRVLPGVEETLQALIDAGVTLGIVSGALEGAARIKLGHGNLNRYFVFGGFGSDSSNRAALTQRAIDKAADLHSAVIEPSEVFVVGDTPNDIVAAKAVGAVAVNVATGAFSAEQLSAAGSDHVMASFLEPFPGL
jgi:phosphoglycolate phosphatase-like HAD superfamily hydrolase